jgi:hypothetical protein
MEEALTKLHAMFPAASATIGNLRALAAVTRSFEYPAFVEPPIVISVEGKNPPQLLSLNFDEVAAWIAHMSLGSRVRMEALEYAILSGLASGRFFVSASLTRNHLEVAGLATYVNSVLVTFSNEQNYERLAKEMLQTAYSSALAKHDPSLIGSKPGIFTGPRSIMNAIDALQDFLDTISDTQTCDIRSLYAFLCDYSHPSIRGVSSFVQVQNKNPRGREFQYSRRESFDSGALNGLLTTLLWSMRVGYTNALLMYCGEIVEEELGFTYSQPKLSTWATIWENVMQLPLPK